MTAYNRGTANAGRRQWEQAIRDYDRAISLAPKFALALYGRGVAKEQLGDRDGAEADVAAARQIDPEVGKQ
jgi:tetratricopeptide (TPR) repeat protein